MVRTTIQLNKRTKDALKKQKLYPNETFDQIIQRLVQERDHDDELSPKTIRNIEEGIKDIKAGRVYTTVQLNKELGL